MAAPRAKNEARFDAVVASLAPVWDGWCAVADARCEPYAPPKKE